MSKIFEYQIYCYYFDMSTYLSHLSACRLQKLILRYETDQTPYQYNKLRQTKRRIVDQTVGTETPERYVNTQN
jgi:hypothetical protein